MKRWLVPVLLCFFPFGLYWTGHSWSVQALGFGFLLALLAAHRVSGDPVIGRSLLCGGLLLLGSSMWFRTALPLKFYPVMVNGVLLGVFCASLRVPPTIIERIARLRDPALPPAGVRYTRRVTQMWCVFFLFNGILSLWSITRSDRVWFWYNGVIAYVLIGSLFCGEWCVRRRCLERWRG